MEDVKTNIDLASAIALWGVLASALVAFAWLPWYPIWAVVIIALDVAVIWARTMHGRDITGGVDR